MTDVTQLLELLGQAPNWTAKNAIQIAAERLPPELVVAYAQRDGRVLSQLLGTWPEPAMILLFPEEPPQPGEPEEPTDPSDPKDIYLSTLAA